MDKKNIEVKMKIYTFTAVQQLPIDLAAAWQFFANPQNLSRITPPWLNFRITSENLEKMYAGQIIEYKVSPFLNIPSKWVTEITHVNEPLFFVDEQRFGPYKFWYHQHHFMEYKGGIMMKDIVSYALPFGFIGRIVNSLLVAKKIKSIFSFRRKYLEDKFGSNIYR